MRKRTQRRHKQRGGSHTTKGWGQTLRSSKMSGGNKYTRMASKYLPAVATGFGLGAASTYTFRKNLPNIPKVWNRPNNTLFIKPPTSTPVTVMTNTEYLALYDALTNALINSQRSIPFIEKNYHFNSETYRLTINRKAPDILQLFLLTIDNPKYFFENLMNYTVTIDSLPKNQLLISICESLISYLESYSDTFTNWLRFKLLNIVPNFILQFIIEKQLPLPINEITISSWITELKSQDFNKLRLKIIELAKAYVQKHKTNLDIRKLRGASRMT